MRILSLLLLTLLLAGCADGYTGPPDIPLDGGVHSHGHP
jgi:hypothetical protein